MIGDALSETVKLEVQVGADGSFPDTGSAVPYTQCWCIVGMSVMYFMALVFVVFQDYSTVRLVIGWLCPEMRNFSLVLPVSDPHTFLEHSNLPLPLGCISI